MDFMALMTPAIETVQSIVERTPRLVVNLPGIFHEEAEKKFSPLWALLLLMEDNFDSVSRTIHRIEMYFDIHHAPAGATPDEPDFLSWLGTWVGLVPEQDWPEEKKRYVLSIAADLHKLRGTMDGLHYMLALFFGIEVQIEEWTWPQDMRIGVINTSGIDTRIDQQYDINNCFTLTWRPGPEDQGPRLKQKIAAIRQMIDREKPAHTWCYFNVIEYEEEG